jgi:hypothetical protein
VGRTTKWTWVLAALLYLALGLWTVTVPLFASPDEPANFVKSAAIVRGDLVGDAVTPETLKSYWTTTVDIDPQFGSVNGLPWCFAPYPEKPACTYDVATAPQVDGVAWTNMGKYPPLGFFFTGIGTIFGPTNLAVYASRTVQVLACMILLAGSATVLWRRGRSLSGLLVALTPGTIFLAATSSPSGLEIVASIATWIAAPLVLFDSATRIERILFLLGGVLLIGVRPLGVIFYGVILVLTLFLGRFSLRTALRRIGVRTVALHCVTILFMLWWYFAIYGPATDNKIAFGDVPLSFNQQLDAIVRGLPRIFEQYIGNFGWLDTPAPQSVVWLGVASLGALGIAVGRMISPRQWFVVGFLLVASVGFTIVADFNYYELLRTFGSQGRHVAPFLVGIPIVLGAGMRRGSKLLVLIGAAWAISMVWSFMVMVRRYSVGVSPGSFMEMWNDPPWVPPLGMSTTFAAMTLVVVGGLWLLWREESRIK